MYQLDLFDQPRSDWKPKPLPTVPTGIEIAVDTETRDQRLIEDGPGWRFRKSQVVGVSVDFDGYNAYWAIGHMFDNTHKGGEVMDWLAEAFSKNRIIMANAPYDIGNLSMYDVPAPKDVVDIQIAESLIEEEGPNGMSLDELAFKYLKERKNEAGIEQFARTQNWETQREIKGSLWRMPGPVVAPYAEADARQTRAVWQHQKVEFVRQELGDISKLEFDIIPIIHRAVKRGIPFDMRYADELNEKWSKVEKTLLARLGARHRDDLGQKDFLLNILKKDGIEPGRTAKGAPSVTKQILENAKTPMCSALREAGVLIKCKRDYLESMMEKVHNGRVHPEFVQTARASGDDKEGTRTGRFASKNPNIQQIPKRSAYESFQTKDLRKCYHADGGLWAKMDYNSQEPRMQVHYGLALGLKGAQEVADGFAKGIKLYKTLERLIDGVTYDQTKTIVLGRSYGMGVAKLAAGMGLSLEEAEKVLKAFDETVPYITQTANAVQESANRKGYVKCMLGRRRHFNWWEPKRGKDEPIPPIYGFDAARARWPSANLRRAHVRKAYNALIQGGCSVQTKLAIRESARAGHDFTMTVHDEISWIVAAEADALRCKEIMETVLPMNLPSVADMDLGDRWC